MLKNAIMCYTVNVQEVKQSENSAIGERAEVQEIMCVNKLKEAHKTFNALSH